MSAQYNSRLNIALATINEANSVKMKQGDVDYF